MLFSYFCFQNGKRKKIVVFSVLENCAVVWQGVFTLELTIFLFLFMKVRKGLILEKMTGRNKKSGN